jgi:transcriptional regulator with XRE-family HTH domain
MRLKVETPADVGAVLRLVRRAQGVRADDLAGSAGVGPVFVLDVENGKTTVQLGKVLQVLREAGIGVSLELPHQIASGPVTLNSKRRTGGPSLLDRLEAVRGNQDSGTLDAMSSLTTTRARGLLRRRKPGSGTA